MSSGPATAARSPLDGVVASQSGAAIFEMSASFHRDEEGTDWSMPMPGDMSSPEALTEFVGPDDRPSVPPLRDASGARPGPPFATVPYWVRLTNRSPGDPAPDDPALTSCILTYLSDMGVLAEARPPDDKPIGSATSLDHAIWFHRPYRPYEWHLFSATSRSNRGGSGLAVAALHHRGRAAGRDDRPGRPVPPTALTRCARRGTSGLTS